MEPYKITVEMNLKNIIAESREVAQELNEFADDLEQIEKKYAGSQESDDKDTVTPKKAYNLEMLDALNEIKEEINNCIVHSPYFHTTSDCCKVRDDVRQIFDKHIKKIEEGE